MSLHDHTAFLLDIQQAAANIASFIESMDEAVFLADKKTQATVQHQIMVIGEATKHLPRTFRENYPIIPWNAIARMRDRLIHGYSTVDMGVVWATATEGIPQLLEVIEGYGDTRPGAAESSSRNPT